jgi:ABC-type polysaccharide/polyol phosphate export permease
MLRLITIIRKHHYVLSNFVTRDLTVKYRGTVAGYLWSLLEPLSLVLVYYFIFGVIAKRGEPDFPLIVILGLLPWNYFNAVVMGGATALRANAGLVLRVHLPREVYVLANAATAIVVMGLSLLVVIPFMFVWDVVPGWRIIFFPLSLLLLSMYGLGIAFVAACINLIYRDVSYVISVLFRFMFYFSATIYPVSMVPERFQYYFLFNPIALCLSMGRNAIMNRPMPFEPVHVVFASVFALLFFVVGVGLFPRLETKAVKFL